MLRLVNMHFLSRSLDKCLSGVKLCNKGVERHTDLQVLRPFIQSLALDVAGDACYNSESGKPCQTPVTIEFANKTLFHIFACVARTSLSLSLPLSPSQRDENIVPFAPSLRGTLTHSLTCILQCFHCFIIHSSSKSNECTRTQGERESRGKSKNVFFAWL